MSNAMIFSNIDMDMRVRVLRNVDVSHPLSADNNEFTLTLTIVYDQQTK